MPSDNSDPFSPARVVELRTEARALGMILDSFLPDEADCPVFGLNLACAYPFPAEVGRAYETLDRELSSLDPGTYIYPLWETHVTIMTLVNFTLHKRPSEFEAAKIRALVPRIIECLSQLSFKPFVLRFAPPVLTRKAAIIPISNPTGEIAKLRADALALIRCDAALHGELLKRGLNVPQIIHSTILRFARLPCDLANFVSGFQTVADASNFGEIRVSEIFLTDETKPYMREGRILYKFSAVASE